MAGKQNVVVHRDEGSSSYSGNRACQKLIVDTAFFKGNYPQHFAVDTVLWPKAEPWQLLTEPLWTESIGKTPLGPDQEHHFDWNDDQAISHLRLRIYPDGGVSRLKLMGKWSTELKTQSEGLNAFNALQEPEKFRFFSLVVEHKGAETLHKAGPFVSWHIYEPHECRLVAT